MGQRHSSDITVREIVDHVVAGNIFAIRLLAGVAEATAGLDADHLGDDPLFAVSASCESEWSAFAGADEERVLYHPSGVGRPAFDMRQSSDDATAFAMADDLAPGVCLAWGRGLTFCPGSPVRTPGSGSVRWVLLRPASSSSEDSREP